MKFTLTLLSIFLTTIIVFSQDLEKKVLSETDRKKGILYRYAYECSDSYCEITLTLYKDNNYKYEVKSFMRDVFSSGKWTKKNNILIINSFIQKNEVPVKLVYSNDTSGMIKNFPISIVKNKKNELLLDGLVRINNDSLQCLPMSGVCIGDYKSIDSLKIVFDNGLSSRWLKVENKNFKKIIPVVQTDLSISSYIPLKRRYKILKSSITILDTME